MAVPLALSDEALRGSAPTLTFIARRTAMVFAAPLRETRGFADGIGQPLQVRLVLEGDEPLRVGAG